MTIDYSNKKESTDTQKNLEESQKHYAKYLQPEFKTIYSKIYLYKILEKAKLY